jgi:hypothetical protein
VQALKRNPSSDSPVTINGNVITNGDAAIGSNAKIIKTTKEKKKPGLLGILVGIIGLIGSFITIYLFLK